MKPIDISTASQLIDFSGGDESLKSLADVQIEGAVSLHNMIVDKDIKFAYLADEVGMGKTYIALGVVALLRYFNPMLRVLYICPSKNVQEKWDREYKNFIRTNIRVSQGRIRTREGLPAAPYKTCNNIIDLLHDASSGYFSDFFIRKDSFSISLSDDKAIWSKRLKELKKIIPAHEWSGIFEKKIDVKKQYAKALNYILPTFDLVVIDEAHNFKHDFESSDRNKILSRVLGFHDSDIYLPRAKQALLLSATPYDRDLNQLRNQLNLIGKQKLLPESIDDTNKKEVRACLKNFMVRRLNILNINGKLHTRNMYRREWRKGPKAEIHLETDEQKLVTALVQKKVGEMLSSQSESPSFQTGLLASFESFAESTVSEPVEFDGERVDKQQTDARDRHVIGHIVDNYVDAGLGRTLPHPKMDSVSKRVADAIFNDANKQLIFVRRVKSVDEIKDKLDDAYNNWVKCYIDQSLINYPVQSAVMNNIYKSYGVASRRRDSSNIGGEYEIDNIDGSLPAKNDTFFAWFFRGEAVKATASHLRQDVGAFPTPDAVRKSLSVKNQVTVNLLEPNWAYYICRQENIDLTEIIECYGDDIAKCAGQYISGELNENHLEVYNACQIALIEWLVTHKNLDHLKYLYGHLKIYQSDEKERVSKVKLKEQLEVKTLFCELEEAGLGDSLIPYQEKVYKALKSHEDVEYLLKRFDIHKTLMSFLLRTGHGIIDLYLARLMQGVSNLTPITRARWIKDFVMILQSQKDSKAFSTYYELNQTAINLELIIKNNIPQILNITRVEYSRFISEIFKSISPVIGASGATAGRSSQARKFRMPGYPLALVSTDVFQEGEDLHTFCDSVVHYGLSGSPISLEQKTGRVDRVGSMAQRRLISLNCEAQDHEFIQVSFPYVKESIETLQVRRVCQNLNEFIDSLHDITTTGKVIDDNVEIDKELALKQPIPDQILSFLKSPYTPIAVHKNKYNKVKEIDDNTAKRMDEIKRVEVFIEHELHSRKDRGIKYRFNDEFQFDITDREYVINLTSAKSNGELLISITCHSDPSIYTIKNRKELKEIMKRFSWETFHRTFSIKSPNSKNDYQLFFNSEMLVGGESRVSKVQIERFFERMEIKHDPDTYSKKLSNSLYQYIESINDNTRVPIDRSQHTKINTITKSSTSILIFNFGRDGQDRTQAVSIYECEGRCVFISYASKKGYCKKLSVDDIIKYTWKRNRHIDLVEFVISPNDQIVGRIVHPLADMSKSEFLYCAYILAVEADNLEYLLSKRDVH